MNEAPPNGATPPQTPDMSPSERKIWANSHALDERYLLVTFAEMKLMGDSMAQQRTLTGALQRTFKECELILADYWRNEPDLPNGVASAVFDAKRFKKGVDLGLVHLRQIIVKLASVPVPGDDQATRDALHAVTKDLNDQVKDLERIVAQRRDRKGKS